MKDNDHSSLIRPHIGICIEVEKNNLLNAKKEREELKIELSKLQQTLAETEERILNLAKEANIPISFELSFFNDDETPGTDVSTNMLLNMFNCAESDSDE